MAASACSGKHMYVRIVVIKTGYMYTSNLLLKIYKTIIIDKYVTQDM